MNAAKERCEICEFYEPCKGTNRGTCTTPNIDRGEGYKPIPSWPDNVPSDHWCGAFKLKDAKEKAD